ncbi:MarR family transcriptional regulator [Streptomyces laculatispora]|uniref:MarR family transcriptional regulator n=1 Tax=Streptomyces laculatispora TaxID=887464 RepID=A0ABY9IGA4_9ACTN|nr:MULTISPECIES: MarR family transcriptional regulator [Streptomyces]ROQ71471.1 DNA-binding MarR family transcriptional regulator [Streptomyces sp. CEV 2-1]WLQ45431.1 MarR family transcriptional regulator [Streptomyces laculatispora]
MGFVTALVRSSFLVDAVYAESGRVHGITAQQGRLLCVLMVQPYGMRELGPMLGLAKSSLTGLVDRSVQRGLVRREADPEDGRAVRVALTAMGDELSKAFYAETCRRVERLSDGLDAADRELLARLLGRLVLKNKVPVVFMEPDQAPPAHNHNRTVRDSPLPAA